MTSHLLAPPSHPEMLGRLGRYEIERLIGAGGMGVVFKGFDSELNRPVAIKVLAPHLAGSGAARKRFAREARAAAAIVHEHVVAIHNVESESELPFLVMQYVPGESLQGRIDREGPLDVCEVLRIARQTASGLAAAHEQGLVHRDVKPSNILLEQGVERTLLTDFGLARASDDASLTHSGHVPGTPHYMSPEQARGNAIDQRSDLFSLGSVIYAMCTGRPPFRAETSYGILRRITDSQPRPIRELVPEIPSWLCRLIERLHAKSPSDRFTSAAEVEVLLAQCLAHAQQPEVQPLPASLARQQRQSIKGTRKSFAAIAVSLIILLGFVMAIQHGSNASRRAGDAISGSAEPEPEVASNDRDDVNTATTYTNNSDPATDWDAGENELREVGNEVGDLRRRVGRHWDEMPTSPQSNIKADAIMGDQPHHKESNQ
ncbi:MAG: serine/threonine protein kinase [Planctomycetes bacterium]|nr:serine/threonine protein kinase [Planctomycetota bacterium]